MPMVQDIVVSSLLTGVQNRLNLGVLGEEIGNRKAISHVRSHADGQGAKTTEAKEAVKR